MTKLADFVTTTLPAGIPCAFGFFMFFIFLAALAAIIRIPREIRKNREVLTRILTALRLRNP